MINQVVRLVAPRHLEIFMREVEAAPDDVVVKPLFLSICAADQRYYTGARKKAVLDKKLPLCLIHEGVGQVLRDPKGQFAPGTKVVMVPNAPTEEDEIIKENYRRSSFFCSSNCDGFMQNLLCVDRKRALPIGAIEPQTASLLEPVSVVINAIDQFKKCAHGRRENFGVWGDGSIGFMMALMLKVVFPQSRVTVFGADAEKMEYFSFADASYSINAIPDNITVDHAFECVGGLTAADAVNQIIHTIQPQGSIGLLGVSENPVRVATRMVLEKGLTLYGNSRSGRDDFQSAIDILQDKAIAAYIRNLISEIVPVGDLGDIYYAFDSDSNNPFKTVMRWQM